MRLNRPPRPADWLENALHKVQPPNRVLKKCNAEFKLKVRSQPEEFDAPLCFKTAMLKKSSTKWTCFMQG